MVDRKPMPSAHRQAGAAGAAALGGPQAPVGVGAIAGDHAELAHLWDQAVDATDAQLARHLATIRHHLVEHFDLEERMMVAAASPNRDRHAADHRRVLQWLDEALTAADGGAYGTARGFLSHDLPTWFTLHLRNLDRLAAPAFGRG